MDIRVKRRVVGLLVIASLAVIFLPALFQRDRRVVVDTTSLIPPRPIVQPIVIAPPIKPQVVMPAPAPEKMFQASHKILVQPSADKPTLALNQQGLPAAWVVQVGSFQSLKRAQELTDKLLEKEFTAYYRSINMAKGEFFRVLVGPYIEHSRALQAKQQLDKAYHVDSRVLSFSAE